MFVLLVAVFVSLLPLVVDVLVRVVRSVRDRVQSSHVSLDSFVLSLVCSCGLSYQESLL